MGNTMISQSFRRIPNVIILFAIIYCWGCSKQPTIPNQPEQNTPNSLTVFVAKPIIQDITLTCNVIGNITPWKTVRVASETAGIVESLHFEKGDYRTKGAILAVIDQAKAQALYDQAIAQHKIAHANHEKMKALTRPQELDITKNRTQQAKAQFKEVEKTYKRLKVLLASGDIRQSQFDEAETAYQVAARAVSASEKQLELARIGARKEDLDGSSAQLAQAEASLRLAKEQLKDSRIIAPLDGTIVDKTIEEGELARIGAPITIMVDMRRVKIETRIPEMESPHIKPDIAVHVTVDALPEETFQGRLSFLSIVADPISHSFPAEVIVENPEGRLRSGMICRLRFVKEIRSNALLINGDMLWVRENGTGVFSVREGKAFFKSVKTSVSYENRHVIESGVSPDDVLITTAPSGLIDGQDVTIDETVERP